VRFRGGLPICYFISFLENTDEYVLSLSDAKFWGLRHLISKGANYSEPPELGGRFASNDLFHAEGMMQTSTAASTVATDETDRLISCDKVVGTAVYNLQGEHLGSIYSLMIDKISGQVAYAVMSFGGFLGIGESYHPLPWKMLKYDVRQGGYVVDLDRRRLEGAPSYTTSDLPNWSDRAYVHRIDDYYGAPPYSF
jgi:hypothetical protein